MPPPPPMPPPTYEALFRAALLTPAGAPNCAARKIAELAIQSLVEKDILAQVAGVDPICANLYFYREDRPRMDLTVRQNLGAGVYGPPIDYVEAKSDYTDGLARWLTGAGRWFELHNGLVDACKTQDAAIAAKLPAKPVPALPPLNANTLPTCILFAIHHITPNPPAALPQPLPQELLIHKYHGLISRRYRNPGYTEDQIAQAAIDHVVSWWIPPLALIAAAPPNGLGRSLIEAFKIPLVATDCWLYCFVLRRLGGAGGGAGQICPNGWELDDLNDAVKHSSEALDKVREKYEKAKRNSKGAKRPARKRRETQD
jgi:hypothetical protein